MFTTHDVLQRTLNWHAVKLGRISSTDADRVLGGSKRRSRLVKELRYELDLRARMQDAIEEQLDMEDRPGAPPAWAEDLYERGDEVFEEFREYVMRDLQVDAIQWGRTMEPRALQALQLREDQEFTFPGAIEREFEIENPPGMRPVIDSVASMPLMSSPDALLNGKWPVEVKCPWNTDNHVKVFVEGPWPMYGAQLTMHALVSGANHVLFASFDPRTNEVPMLYTSDVVIPEPVIDRLHRGCMDIWKHVIYGTDPADLEEMPTLF